MDPGTVLAVVSLSFEVFAGCIKGFVMVSNAHNLGKDASYLRTMLNLEEYRFTQWAVKVNLLQPDAAIAPRLNQALASNLMGQLNSLLQADKISERYKLHLLADRPIKLPSSPTQDDLPQNVLSVAVSDETRGEILAKAKLIQSKNSLPKRLWWAAFDKAKFEGLVQDVRAIVQGLWALLDSIQQDEVTSSIQQVLSTVVEISKDVKGLQELQTVLKESRVGSRTSVSLSTAAGLKAATIQLGTQDIPRDDEMEQRFMATALGPSKPKSGLALRQDIILPPLIPTLLTDIVTKEANPSVGTALYCNAPVLVEYKSVSLRMRSKLRFRVENLAVLLSTAKDPEFLTLNCLGFFEDTAKSCFVFVYAYPAYLSEGIGSQSRKISQPVSLHDILRDPKFRQPSATTRLRLGLDISRTLLAFHTAGWLHKNIRSENILFFPAHEQDASTPEFLSRPYLTGFGFSRYDSPTEISEQPSADPLHDIYRHHCALGDPSTSFEKYMDLYSLGTVMIEIAEWRPLKHVVQKCVDVATKGVEVVSLEKIAKIGPWLIKEKVRKGVVDFRMGEIFGRAVGEFLEGESVEPLDADTNRTEIAVLEEAVRNLEKCVL